MSLFKKLWNRLLWVQYKVNVWCANMNRWIGNDDLHFLKYLIDKEVGVWVGLVLVSRWDVRIEQLTKEYEERLLR